VPKLQKKLKVHIQNEFIPRDKLYELYNRSKVYLYSSQQPPFGLGDGFGLQPLEALVCGCTVFSNLHGGLSDYLDPEVCGYKLETFSLEYDVNRILKKVREYSAENSKSEYLRQKYSIKSFNDKMKVIWPEIEDFLQTKNRAPQTLISDLCAQRPSLYFRARKRLRNGLAKTGPLKRRERF
jgi:glycosyltransferase involved in cell wall biosynthesis